MRRQRGLIGLTSFAAIMLAVSFQARASGLGPPIAGHDNAISIIAPSDSGTALTTAAGTLINDPQFTLGTAQYNAAAITDEKLTKNEDTGGAINEIQRLAASGDDAKTILTQSTTGGYILAVAITDTGGHCRSSPSRNTTTILDAYTTVRWAAMSASNLTPMLNLRI